MSLEVNINLGASMEQLAKAFEELGAAFRRMMLDPLITYGYMMIQAESQDPCLWAFVRSGPHWLLVIVIPGARYEYQDGLIGWQKCWLSIGRIMNRHYFHTVWAWHGQPEESFEWT